MSADTSGAGETGTRKWRIVRYGVVIGKRVPMLLSKTRRSAERERDELNRHDRFRQTRTVVRIVIEPIGPAKRGKP